MNYIIPFIAFTIFFIFYMMKFKPIIALVLGIVDFIKLDKKKFRGFGFWLYCGLGGSGKTISMVEYLNRMHKKYPKLKIYTNFNYKYADGKITSWQDLIDLSLIHI